MNAHKYGDTAFPIVASTGDLRDGVYCANGLTKREWFAGQALVGGCMNPGFNGCAADIKAAYCAGVADAMIAELSKQPEVMP